MRKKGVPPDVSEAAAAMGRLGAAARKAKMTPRERSAMMKKVAEARWAKKEKP